MVWCIRMLQIEVKCSWQFCLPHLTQHLRQHEAHSHTSILITNGKIAIIFSLMLVVLRVSLNMAVHDCPKMLCSKTGTRPHSYCTDCVYAWLSSMPDALRTCVGTCLHCLPLTTDFAKTSVIAALLTGCQSIEHT